MYILEIFVKWLNKRQLKEIKPIKPSFDQIDEALSCEHNFMPIDSTGLILACTKCGFVVKRGRGNLSSETFHQFPNQKEDK